MIDEKIIDAGKILGSVFLLIVAAWRGRGWLLRSGSKDIAVVAVNDAEVSMMQRLENETAKERARADEERARADRAYAERNEAVAKIAGMQVTVVGLEAHKVDCDRRLLEMEKDMRALRGLIEELARRGEIRGTDPL